MLVRVFSVWRVAGLQYPRSPMQCASRRRRRHVAGGHGHCVCGRDSVRVRVAVGCSTPQLGQVLSRSKGVVITGKGGGVLEPPEP